jgi:hypothetical protein
VFADAFFIGHARPIAVAVKRGDQLAIGEQSASTADLSRVGSALASSLSLQED